MAEPPSTGMVMMAATESRRDRVVGGWWLGGIGETGVDASYAFRV